VGTRTLNPGQRQITRHLAADLDQGKVALIEAATGTGKGFAIAVAAEQALARGQGPVIVCGPSVQVVQQLVGEWRATGYERRMCLLLGRRQFVDPAMVAILLQGQIDGHGQRDKAVAAWFAGGGGDVGNPATALVHALYPGICWLADDLQHIATDFPVSDCACDEESGSQALAWYTQMRAQAKEAEIVFCTHAMVAIDNTLRTKKTNATSILPDAGVVLIDEAHLFEQAVAGAASRGLALSRLMGLLRPDDTWRSTRLASRADDARQLCASLMETCRRIESDHIFGLEAEDAATRAARNDMARVAQSLLDSLGGLTSKKFEESADVGVKRRRYQVKQAARVLEAVVDGKSRITLTFAPVRRYPTLAAGPMSVRHLLTPFWERTPAAALFSATLFLPAAVVGVDDSFIRSVLCLPPGGRTVAHAPVIPEWVTGDVQLWQPSVAAAPGFLPPSGETEDELAQALERWAGTMAQTLAAHILPSAQGGTLVLVPSKAGVAAIAQALQAMMQGEDIGARLIVHTEGVPVPAARARYIDIYRAGKKPIWIATGPAWTGLDLRDAQAQTPAQDRLLTDLVVPRVPFGVNRSATAMGRERWMGYRATVSEAAMLLKQGFGRLVRREGLQDRRLWLLDARLVLPEFASRMGMASAMLRPYMAGNRHVFD
jgi:Rad3-related DNA helicase